MSKSFCSQITSRTIINPKSAVLLFGRVVQGVRLTYVPPSLTDLDCKQCDDLLWIKVIKSDIVPGVSVEYIPNSKYQFLVEFNFFSTSAIPVFTFTIQLNPKFRSFFSQQDMDQVEIVNIDPAILALFDEPDILTFGETQINENKEINIPEDARKAVLGD